jgi:hypothetical protein
MLGAAGVLPHTKLFDLKRRLKCQSCRWRGRAAMSIEWAEINPLVISIVLACLIAGLILVLA